ncbi:hypothetical protein BDZ97DRAFT_1769794 [Flammula alnicola]|nr:hypothetical protein BDZ97DRAFT_1769794 [Flammula alnicola]
MTALRQTPASRCPAHVPTSSTAPSTSESLHIELHIEHLKGNGAKISVDGQTERVVAEKVDCRQSPAAVIVNVHKAKQVSLLGTGADTRAGLRLPKFILILIQHCTNSHDAPIKPARVSVPTGPVQTRTCKHGIPYPWPRVRVLAGTGAGRQKFARGLPVPITSAS